MSKIAVVIGAGPAGLTAAYEIANTKKEIKAVVIEATDRIGGISCTINYKGNRIDIGGHRFFSKSDIVMDWWTRRMPVQGSPAIDDLLLNKNKAWVKGGPDPEKTDRVMLIRERISRIFYLRKFFDYPISLKNETIANLGLINTIVAGIGYVSAQVFRRKKEVSLKDFMINRFGRPLYKMFFEDYTEKVWGVHPARISAEWGAQRIKGLSLSKAIFQAVKKVLNYKSDNDVRQKQVETSLIEQFYYPKYGPGQLWEHVADDIVEMGGTILMNSKVTAVNVINGKVISVTVFENGSEKTMDCDYCISSMPIKDIVAAFSGDQVPVHVKKTAAELPYRDFMTVGLLVKKMNIKNETLIKTLQNVIPDTWIYVQERDVKMCRLQIFNNWSPYMVANPDHVWIGLEYMCSEEDKIWRMSDEDFIDLAVQELVTIGMINRADIVDSCRIHIEKAYPAYFGSYEHFDSVREFLDRIENLYCVGRNGQHRYNNQDHSMLTAMEAVRCITTADNSKEAIWSVNSEQEYHEVKK